FGSLLRSTQLAVADPRRSSDWSGLDAERCSIWAGLPNAERSSEPIASPDAKVEYKNPALEEPIVFPQPATLLKPMAGLITYGILPDHQHLIQRGSAGFAVAVLEAQRQLLGSELTHAVILAVDSLIESHTLQWLHDHDRLKTDVNP